jgi:hypothetical protein
MKLGDGRGEAAWGGGWVLRYDEAQAAYQRALALSPGDEGIKARIGRVKARLGE